MAGPGVSDPGIARALAGLVELREQLDAEAGALHRLHAGRLRCGRGCSSCCVDDISVFEIEARLIRERHAELLASGEPHPEGACAFLDAEGACRVYPDRPYVCRTQGLPLRWLDEGPEGETVELRDICELNDRGEPLEELPAQQCWTLGPVEARLAALQAQSQPEGGEPRRVRLRDLFSASGRSSSR